MLTGEILESEGIGGRLKQQCEDFVVEEIPAYEPAGEGSHLFLWIEKRNRTTQQLIHHVARTVHVAARDIGSAGLKDRVAITRQYLSIPADRADRVAAIDTDSIRVLHTQRHGNKLRTGHLKGNRFNILVRDVRPDALTTARAIQERIQLNGFPNYFGEQRFGIDRSTLATGLQLLQGEKQSSDLPRGRGRFLLRLAISAVQSDLFNTALNQRIHDACLHTVLAGDVMQVRASGGLFVADDVETEQARFNRRETSITGPMFGSVMTQPSGETAIRERRILEASGLDDNAFRRFPKLSRGTRRPYSIWPSQLEVQAERDGLRFTFELPKGTYATTLMQEFMQKQKAGVDGDGSPAVDL